MFRRAFRKKLGVGQHRILEMGAGGGHTLSHLSGDFEMAAIDLSPQMLRLSSELNPGVPHYEGDMRTMRLGRAFDGVMVHDAISHMLTEGDLMATFETAKAHLRTGGVLLVAPEWVDESFQGASDLEWFRSQGRLKVTIKEHLHDPDPTDTQIESVFTYLIEEGGEMRVEQDTHVSGLFPINTWQTLIRDAGFDVEMSRVPVNDGGYGGILFSGVLRP